MSINVFDGFRYDALKEIENDIFKMLLKFKKSQNKQRSTKQVESNPVIPKSVITKFVYN